MFCPLTKNECVDDCMLSVSLPIVGDPYHDRCCAIAKIAESLHNVDKNSDGNDVYSADDFIGIHII